MIERVAMVSAHTSPLGLPGSGNAGGMNVAVLETARHLAAWGTEVEIFARGEWLRVVEPSPGVIVRELPAGELTAALMAAAPRFTVMHSHYWISGQIALPVRERHGLPLVHTMHTMGRVKNLSLAAGDRSEPATRITAEAEIVRSADRLMANTTRERDELVSLYGADRGTVDVVHPGVDLDVFRSGRKRTARDRLGIAADVELVVFAGRIQPHKAPDVLIDAVALMPRSPRLVVIGGPSGAPFELRDGAETMPPMPQVELATWFAAADIVCVPSFSESFGLVAIEAQACGTPVVAARVGGLSTAVVDGVTGILVDGHAPEAYAAALTRVLDDRAMHASMSTKAVVHASGFTWSSTAEQSLRTYEAALRGRA